MPDLPSTYPVDFERTAIAVGYSNAEYVADRVLPRVRVARKEYRYTSYPLEESFSVPDTFVGRRSSPTMIHLSADEKAGVCRDFALEDAIPRDDVDNAPQTVRDPRDRSSMTLADLLMIDREKRAADLVFKAETYPIGNKAALAGASRWSDADSDPVTAIINAVEGMVAKPNRLLLGSQVWAKLRTHKKVVGALGRRRTDAGIALREEVADLFELAEIVVGQAWINTAARGQAASLSRVWGKHALLYRADPMAGAEGPPTLGITAEYVPAGMGGGDTALPGRTVYTGFDPKIGGHGSYVVRVVESCDEKIVASRAGYLFADAVV